MVDEALAARVADALQLAGLPRVSRSDNFIAGFWIQPAEEFLRVGWNPSPEPSETVFEKLEDSNIRDPAVLHSGRIKRAMTQAILAILLSAGINARMSRDDLTPFTVEVIP